jgi:hypothetical protein
VGAALHAGRREHHRAGGLAVHLVLGDEVGEAELAGGQVAQAQLVEHHLHAHEVAHPGEEREVVEGLGQKVVSAGLEPAHPFLRRVERRDHDDGDVRGLGVGLERGADRKAVHVGHHHVEHHHVGLLGAGDLERAPAAFRDDDVVVCRGELGPQEKPVGGDVVDDQHPTRHSTTSLRRHGSIGPSLLRDTRRKCVNEGFSGGAEDVSAAVAGRSQRSAVSPLTAEALARDGLLWLVNSPELAGRFLAETGAGPADLRAGAGDPAFLGALLDFLLADEARLVAFATEVGIDPAEPARPGRPCLGATCRTGPEPPMPCQPSCSSARRRSSGIGTGRRLARSTQTWVKRASAAAEAAPAAKMPMP